MIAKRLRKYVRPLYTKFWKGWMRITDRGKDRYPIVHQGIQRSGTNFLSMILAAGGYCVLNRIDPPRHDPRHKHFRWQNEKDTIVMDARYSNCHVACSVADINVIANWPEGTRHVVLFRDPRDWIDAIFRWGIANDWFPSADAFFARDLHRVFLREWHAYYAQWAAYATRDPDLVLLLRYLDLQQDASGALARIDAFSGVVRARPLDLAKDFSKVRHSRPISEPRARLTLPELDEAVAEGGSFDWRAHAWVEAVK